jgi:hypothetical protein
MTPRFKGKPDFDRSLPCSLSGYRIQPKEAVRPGSNMVKCPSCGEVFNEMGEKAPERVLSWGSES